MTTNTINQPPEMLGIGTRAYAFADIQVITFDGTSGTSAAVGAVEVCLFATEACYINLNADATDETFPLPANLHFHMRVAPEDLIEVIQSTTGGNLYIIPVA